MTKQIRHVFVMAGVARAPSGLKIPLSSTKRGFIVTGPDLVEYGNFFEMAADCFCSSPPS